MPATRTDLNKLTTAEMIEAIDQWYFDVVWDLYHDYHAYGEKLAKETQAKADDVRRRLEAIKAKLFSRSGMGVYWDLQRAAQGAKDLVALGREVLG